MPGTKTKKQKIIMEAAARLFRKKGYPATSMRDLAKAVELKPSSLYNHIESKEEILQEICFETAQRFHEGMNEIETKEISVKEKVEALIRLHIQMAVEDVTSVTSFNDEWRHLSEPQLSEFIKLRKDYENRFLQLIKEGIQEGIFVAIDPTISLYTIFSAVRWVYHSPGSGQKLELNQLEKQISRILMNGLAK